jgi:carbamoyl-phosphate synthase large subunit
MRAVAGVNEPDTVFRSWILGERMSPKAYRSLVCLRYLNEVYLLNSTYDRMASTGRVENGASEVLDYF